MVFGAFFIVCQSDPDSPESQHVSSYTVGVAAIEPHKTVAPGESIDLMATIENTGDTEWGTTTTWLAYVGDEDAGGVDVPLSAATAPGEMGTFRGTMTAPTDEGDYELVWQPIIEGYEIGTPLAFVLTVEGGDDSGTDDSGKPDDTGEGGDSG
jgi:hypothetical protein